MLFRKLPRPGGLVSIALLAALVVGCGAGARSRSTVGVSSELELSQVKDDEPRPEPERPAPDVVPRAARPFVGWRRADGQSYTPEELLTTLASADAVCVGERHDDPLDHFAQLRTIDGLLERRRLRGFELGVGLEMVRVESQGSLTEFEAFRVDIDELTERVDWDGEWGFPIEYYGPQLLTARSRGARLLALGVDQGTTREIAEKGLEGLDDYERGRLPELDFSVDEHRAIFDQLMAGHPGAKADVMDRFYQAQVVWDESMAATSARFLSERQPGRKLVIMAGTAHCHREAIPARIERRTGFRVVSLLPVAGGQSIPKDDVSSVDARIAQGYEFQMVFDR